MVLKNDRSWKLLPLLITGVCFYLQYQYNLFLDDDYLFSSITGTDLPINSVKDALASQAIAYMQCNGRFVVHTFVQLFCGIWGATVFALINTLVFVLFFIFVFKLTVGGAYQLYKGFLLLVFLWFFIPVQGVAFLGNIAFSVNYLWTSTATLGFLLLYRDTSTATARWWRYSWLLLTGVLVGSLHEGFSTGLAGALLVYYGFHRKELKGQHLYLVVGYWLGTLLILAAPGNFIRMQGEQAPLLHSGIKWFLLTKWSYLRSILNSTPVLIILSVTFVLMALRNVTAAWAIMKKYQLYLTAVFFNVLFALVIAYMGAWQIIPSALFAIIVLVRLLFEKFEPPVIRYRVVILIVSGVLLCSTYVYALILRRELYMDHRALVSAARTTTTGVIWGDYEVTGRMMQREHPFMRNYFRVVFYMGDKYHKHILSTYLTKGKNPNLVKCVLPFSPEKIAAFCLADNQLVPSVPIYKTGPAPFIIIKASSHAALCQYLETLNQRLINPRQKLALDDLGSEVYLYHGTHFAVLFNRGFVVRPFD